MNQKNKRPECFGCQSQPLLYGRDISVCVDCEWFEKCHKITVSACLMSISDAMDLIVQNGLADGRLKGFEELEKLIEKR